MPTSASAASPKVTTAYGKARAATRSRTRAVRATAPGSSALITSSRTPSAAAKAKKPSA